MKTRNFVSRDEFEKWYIGMSRAELQQVYNKIPGAPLRKRLRNKATALDAIWKATPKATPPPARDGSKKSKLIAMMKRKSGTTVPELMEKFGWEAHTCRGLISTLNAKGVVKVETSKNRAGKTVYRAA